LDERLKPTPEEPVKLRNDEERNKDGAKEDADGGGHHTKSDDNQCQTLSDNRRQPQQCIKKHGNRLSDARCFEIAKNECRIVGDALGIRLADFVRKNCGFVGNQVMEIAAKAGDGRVVVVHHGKAKADHQNQAYEIRKVEAAALIAGGQGRFDAVPNHQNGRESPK